MKVTYRCLLTQCEEQLQEAGVPDAAWDAWLILEHCFALTRSRYFLKRDELFEPDETVMNGFWSMTKRRAERIPLQYLFGCQEFMGLPFLVGDSVLIPRADTETLVEAVLADCAAAGKNVLDLCTGSGCIAISLRRYGSFARVDASDLSDAALETARRNAQNNHANIGFYRSDLFDGITETYDVIVSNPPYIADEMIETLEPEVKDHEPRMALSGGADGLQFYRKIAEQAVKYLTDHGRIYLEIGYDQAEAVRELLEANGFCDVIVKKDLAGNDRVVCAIRK